MIRLPAGQVDLSERGSNAYRHVTASGVPKEKVAVFFGHSSHSTFFQFLKAVPEVTRAGETSVFDGVKADSHRDVPVAG